MLNPEEPSVKSYESALREIPFPLTFTICIEADIDYTYYLKESGYYNLRGLFKGNFMRNKGRGQLKKK